VIKVNLLTVERQQTRKKIALPTVSGNGLTIACSLILVLTAAGIGWRFWTLHQESAQLGADIAAAQQETARLHSIIEQVQQFEQRRAQLQQRVGLIEQLRKDQTGPVHMLDQISRSLPDMLWLTNLKQSPDGKDVTIEGRSTTLTGLSDFVVNLEHSGYFKRSVEIVSTEVDTTPAGDLITFTVRGVFQQPGPEAPATAATTAEAPAPPAPPAAVKG
jgi:type IV pilus assembly protein PilN